MTGRPDHLPERLALLPNAEAVGFLTEGLLTGREDVPSIRLNQVTEPLSHTDRRGDLLPVRDLAEDAMAYCRHEGLKVTQADAWLAPRLHAVLRLTRREAADPGLWNHLALGVAPDYVIWRHLPDPPKDGTAARVATERFRGPYHKQAFARLWWAAELFRDGSDYGPVVTACGNQDILNTALRMSVINHRPTAQAIVRLVAKGVITGGREANALAGAVNASAATLMYDVIAPDTDRDSRRLLEWIDEGETARQVSRTALPTGPDEEPAPEASVETLVDYFADLFADAPVRGREEPEDGEGRD
ncbi:DUF6339 family protein [Streptomyces kanasensis]|uniref:DUF6339 family protein n=1 Tax=Streptomyces kanasensis TaxID=936756 RepID=UPI00382EC1E3